MLKTGARQYATRCEPQALCKRQPLLLALVDIASPSTTVPSPTPAQVPCRRGWREGERGGGRRERGRRRRRGRGRRPGSGRRAHRDCQGPSARRCRPEALRHHQQGSRCSNVHQYRPTAPGRPCCCLQWQWLAMQADLTFQLQGCKEPYRHALSHHRQRLWCRARRSS